MHTLKITSHRTDDKNNVHSGMLIHKITGNTKLLYLDVRKDRKKQLVEKP